MVDYYDEEVEYTKEEEAEVMQQLEFSLIFRELQLMTTKHKLKSWFADIQMKKSVMLRQEYCPNITGEDLVDIATKSGFKVVGGK